MRMMVYEVMKGSKLVKTTTSFAEAQDMRGNGYDFKVKLVDLGPADKVIKPQD